MGKLEKLVQEYPYFQLGRMLYLKNLHNENSIDYEKNLHITSAYASNGKVLYNLIKKKKEERPEVIMQKQETEQTVFINPLSEIHIEAKTEKEIIPKLEPVALLQEMPMATKEVKKDEYDELEVLEKEMLREVYRTSMTIDLIEGKEAEDKVQEAREKPSSISHPPSSISQTYSFNDWLKVISGNTPESVIEEKTIQKKQKSEIIDKFILEETVKIAPKPKAEFYSAEGMAKKSIQDNEVFVSETLASIYLKQGNLPKALRAYEILLVKHPEKFHIFAPLLEKIKKLLKDQKQ